MGVTLTFDMQKLALQKKKKEKEKGKEGMSIDTHNLE